MIASRADCVYRENAEYDDNMLKFLTQINPDENNLIVFHGNGSHASYVARYPAEDAVLQMVRWNLNMLILFAM